MSGGSWRGQSDYEPASTAVCNYSYVDESYLETHYRDPKTHPFRCNFCKHEFSCNMDFWYHCFDEHQEKDGTVCPLCAKLVTSKLSDKLEWDDHLANEHCLVPCTACYEVFRTDSQMQQHFNDRHRFTCVVCLASFEDESLRQLHFNAAHQYLCSICHEYTNSSEDLKHHYQIVHVIRCFICERTFNVDVERDEHARLVHQTQCPVCGLRLDFASVQLDHFNAVHQLPCDLCDVICVTVPQLQLHYVSLHDKEYAEDSDLWSDIDSNGSVDNQNLKSCYVCDLAFPSEVDLVKHYRNQHIHICLICNEEFQSDKDLLVHKIGVHLQRGVSV